MTNTPPAGSGPWLHPALRCPETHGELTVQGEELVCGEIRYPTIRGTPILLPLESAFDDDSSAAVESHPSLSKRIIQRLTPRRAPRGNARDRYQHFVRLVGSGTVLVIGGGRLGEGAEVLLEAPSLEVIETDVYIGPRTQVVCDGHRLPFADNSMDGVVIQAVLEHVLDPPRVVGEIHRVLRPGGVVFAETPFMQQVHEGPYDFTRWTEVGHRRLFQMFTTVETGITAGPGVALLWSIIYFARALAPSGVAQPIAERVVLWSFWWLKSVDRYLIDRPAATDGASGVFFLGRSRSEPVAAAEIIGSYRGALGAPVREA